MQRLSGRLLSYNSASGASSRLLEAPAGWVGRLCAIRRDRFLFLAEGALRLAGRPVEAGSLIVTTADDDELELKAMSDVLAFVKVTAER
jgi:hypothetical protein